MKTTFETSIKELKEMFQKGNFVQNVNQDDDKESMNDLDQENADLVGDL